MARPLKRLRGRRSNTYAVPDHIYHLQHHVCGLQSSECEYLADVWCLLGMGVDQIVSVRLVTADGNLQTVSSSNSDLFWAVRGAGPNFGIVTSAVVKS